MVVHPGEVHANRSTGARAFRSAYVDGSLVAELVGSGWRGGGDGRAPPFVPAPVVRCPEAVGAFGACLDAADAAVAASPLEIESRLSGALRLLLLAAGVHAPSLPACPDRREHRAVARAKEMLRAGHDGDLSLRALAAATGLHPNYLLNVFTREVGVSPHRYLAGVRVEQAKALLRRGQPVAEVALATGFSDQSHLTRAFKRHTLLTPGRYRAGEAAGSGDL
jgi:AraC-like DNA-binding protein